MTEAPTLSRSDNPLQTAVLNLFVTMKSRFPNLVVGTVTRDSVKKALSNGITADQVRHSQTLFVAYLLITFVAQIIKYLTAHAHPQMRKNVSLALLNSTSTDKRCVA